MLCLITITISAMLYFYNILSIDTFTYIGIGSMALMGISAFLYFKFGFLKSYYHGLLGWHIPGKSVKSFDGCSVHAKCKYCRKEIIQDSQGNWFTFD